MLSIMLIFTALANVFIQSGFNTALIQNKDVTEEDYSSVLWVSLIVSAILYIAIYVGAPYLAEFYNMHELIKPLRVIAVILFPGAINSIQLAKVSREMDFKQVFKSNVAGVFVSGVLGIAVAYMGGGLWALVVQQISNVVTTCIVMRFTVKWKIKFVCNIARVKILFAYGWKLLVSGLLDTLYQDISSLVIGAKYNSATLGFYNRGKQFPQFIINAINGTVQSVMLPAMSAEQDDRTRVKSMMRNSITLSAYIIFPMMAGLAAVATPLIKILLTDKWLPAVPYMMIFCFTFAFYPVHSCNLQAINAMGRSDIFLKLEIIKKIQGILLLLIAIYFFDSPLAIAAVGLVGTWTGWFINAYPNKKLIDYSYLEQIVDIMPSFVMALLMFGAVFSLNVLNLNIFIKIIVQIVIGILVYLVLSVIVRPMPFKLLLKQCMDILKRFKKV